MATRFSAANRGVKLGNRLVDLAAKDTSQFEVRRNDALSASPNRQNRSETYSAKLSTDGRTVTSMRLTEDNIQLIEVWDTGKGTICRVDFEQNEQVQDYLQVRLINKNLLFACVKRLGQSAQQN